MPIDVHSQVAGEEIDTSWRVMVDQLEVSVHSFALDSVFSHVRSCIVVPSTGFFWITACFVG